MPGYVSICVLNSRTCTAAFVRAFIYVTHDQAEALTMSDRLAVMMEGDILQIGAPNEVYRDPQDLRVAEFVGSPQDQHSPWGKRRLRQAILPRCVVRTNDWQSPPTIMSLLACVRSISVCSPRTQANALSVG